MKTINEDITKLEQTSQERDKAWAGLNKYFLGNQDNLPQELVAAWGEFEVSEKEAKTMETKAIKGIKGEIRNVRLVKKFDAVMRVMLIGLFILSIGQTFYITFSAFHSLRYPTPKDLGGCNSLFGC